MRIGKWNTWASFGWYSGDPPVGFVFKVFEVVEDYPEGWAWVTFLGIQVGKFTASVGIRRW